MDNLAVSFYGYTDAMPPMEKARVENHLTTHRVKGIAYRLVKDNGVLYSRTEHLRNMVKGGYTFQSEECSGKTTYWAWRERWGIKLNKTDWLFCCYLADNGYGEDEKASQYVVWEKEEHTRREQLRQQEAQAKRDLEERERQKKDTLEAAVARWSAELANTCPQAVAYATAYLSKRGYAFHPRILGILALLQHPEVAKQGEGMTQLYFNALAETLATHNGCSRKLFEMFTGQKLPTTNKGTLAVLHGWLRHPVIRREDKQPIPEKP